MQTRRIAVMALAALGIAFAVANFDEVRVNWLLDSWRTPLIVVIALSMLVGAALGFLVSRRRD